MTQPAIGCARRSARRTCEFQINSNGYNAEFGRASAGIINIVSKSGTNQFHGNVYNFPQRATRRAQPFPPRSGKIPFKRNQPGFTFGGPIRKDKTFFFAAYEGLIRRESAFTTIRLIVRSCSRPTASRTLSTHWSDRLTVVCRWTATKALLTTAPDSPFQANRNTFKLLDGSTGAFPIETSSRAASGLTTV